MKWDDTMKHADKKKKTQPLGSQGRSAADREMQTSTTETCLGERKRKHSNMSECVHMCFQTYCTHSNANSSITDTVLGAEIKLTVSLCIMTNELLSCYCYCSNG